MQLTLPKQGETPLQKPFVQPLARLRLALVQLASALLGALLAHTQLFGAMAPLGVAFAIAAPQQTALFTIVGAAAAYALGGTLGNVAPHLAVCALLFFVRLARPQTPVKQLALGAGTFFFVLGTALLLVLNAPAGQYLLLAAQAVLLAVAGIVLRRFFAVPHRPYVRAQTMDKAAQLTALAFCVAACTPLRLWYLPLVGIAAGACCLVAASRGGEGAAPVFGAVCALAVFCVAPAAWYIGFSVALGAAAAGVFAGQGRARLALAYALAACTGLAAAPDVRAGILLFTQILFADAFFLALPAAWVQPYAAPAPPKVLPTQQELFLTGRLQTLGASLENVGETVQAVCRRLPNSAGTFADVCNAVANGVCRTCPRSLLCWVDKYGETMDCLQMLKPRLAEGIVTVQDLPPLLGGRCTQGAALANEVNRRYAAFAARQADAARGRLVRCALTEQYGALAKTLARLAGEMAAQAVFDEEKTMLAEEALRHAALAPLSVQVMAPQGGRRQAAVTLAGICTQTEKRAAQQALSQACGCEMQQEKTQTEGDTTRLLFTQACPYALCFGLAQAAANGGAVCGDAVRTATTPNGTAYAVLCDGMGTGKEAAVDGSMAAALSASLLEAGFACPETARLVNVALSLKSEADSSAGVDLCTVNLYTARACICKAGGAPSYFIRDGKVHIQRAEGLPIGILGGVMGRSGSFTLAMGDRLLFVSDGAVAGDREVWLGHVLARLLQEQDPTAFAEAVLRQITAQGAKDDVSVLVLQLQPAAKAQETAEEPAAAAAPATQEQKTTPAQPEAPVPLPQNA